MSTIPAPVGAEASEGPRPGHHGAPTIAARIDRLPPSKTVRNMWSSCSRWAGCSSFTTCF